METIEIQILAQDVNNAGNFTNIRNCTLATAIKRQLNIKKNVGVGTMQSRVGDFTYYHNYEYGYEMYIEDITLSIDVPEDTLIRTILLTK